MPIQLRNTLRAASLVLLVVLTTVALYQAAQGAVFLQGLPSMVTLPKGGCESADILAQVVDDGLQLAGSAARCSCRGRSLVPRRR